MKSVKCPKCQLVNFATQTVCRRCAASLNLSASAQNTADNSKNSDNPREVTRNQEIGIGIFLFAVSLFLFIDNWFTALHDKEFYTAVTIFSPVGVALGLCFLIIPFPHKEHFPKAEYAPKSWAFLMLPGFIIGALNWLYFMGII